MEALLAIVLFSGFISVSVPIGHMTAGEALLQSGQGVSVRVEGGLPGWVPGAPDLPGVPWVQPLPAGRSAVSVQVVRDEWTAVPGVASVRPLPPPTPLCLQPAHAGIAEPDPAIYGVSGFWPGSPVLLAGTSNRNGSPAAELIVFPYRFDPARAELQRLTALEVRIVTETAPPPRGAGREPGFQRMLVITVPSLKGVFDQLAARRYSEGIPTEVVTMDEVLLSAGGRDDAEALRNYIIAYRQTHGLDYVLLGGDIEHVPMRYAFAMECQAGFHPREDSLPCDLYYSDLDGDWDANQNGIFGEIGDEIDLFPDVWVGRVTVNDPAEAQAWFDKLAAYEDCTQYGHLQDVLFLAEVLWTNPFTDGGVSKNLIQELCLPGFMSVTKLYQTLGNLNTGTVAAAMNAGTNFINHNGHAWYNGMSIGPGGLIGASFLNGLNSGGRYSALFYSIGCWSAAFDFDAVAEHFLTSPQACGVAFIGNSSYGWGSPGNPAYGYSDILDRYFFQRLYQDRNTRLGQTLAEAKDFYIPYGRWENVYRWHLYQVNLLGDPSFRPYRKIPSIPVMDFPPFVTGNTTSFPVQVSGCMTEGLLLCVHDQGSSHFTAVLDASGHHSFVFDTPPAGDVTVTLTGSGVRRTSLVCPQGTGAGLVVADFSVEDTGGDGFLSPGDSAQVSLTVMNHGTEPVQGIGLSAQLTAGPAVLLSNSMTFPDLVPGEAAQGSAPLLIAVDQDALNNGTVSLLISLSSQQGSWEVPLTFLIHAPGLYFATYSVDDGDDMVPEPGETFSLVLNIANTGLLDAHEACAAMTSFPSWMTFLSDTAFCPLIPSGSTGEFTFQCVLSPDAPSPSFPWLHFQLQTPTTGYERADSLRLTVGETGIVHDVESGPEGWSHGGTGDMWRITGLNSHSPDNSWQCGGDDGYQDGMNCWLQSPDMRLAPNSSLSFWTTFDVALYGSDGLYPVLLNLTAGTADTLDFIGSGGALHGQGRGMGTGWVSFTYDLSSADPEDTYRIEFRFRSDMDGDTGIGFFIDDIVVSGGYQGELGASEPGPVLPALGYPSPNPASSAFSVPVSTTVPGTFVLGLYDLAGRLVMSVQGSSPFTGEVPVNTSGLASGIYLLRLSGNPDPARRVVVLR